MCAVNDISFDVNYGQIVGLVGESGSGKSVTARSIMGLVRSEQATVEGSVFFEGVSLLDLSNQEIHKNRGKKMSMVFQEPMTSLNPVFRIGRQIDEVFEIHQKLSRREAKQATLQMLRKVKIPEPSKCYHEFPHQLSGGMRQRIMIAMALACKPQLLLADDPTTALDVTIQAQILNLMKSLQSESQMSILLITHDLGVIANFCDHVMVMYAGKIVEEANVEELFNNPKHPYTKGLLASIPKIGNGRKKLETIEGIVPSPDQLPAGCSFHDRCVVSEDRCKNQSPTEVCVGKKHSVSCWTINK